MHAQSICRLRLTCSKLPRMHNHGLGSNIQLTKVPLKVETELTELTRIESACSMHTIGFVNYHDRYDRIRLKLFH